VSSRLCTGVFVAVRGCTSRLRIFASSRLCVLARVPFASSHVPGARVGQAAHRDEEPCVDTSGRLDHFERLQLRQHLLQERLLAVQHAAALRGCEVPLGLLCLQHVGTWHDWQRATCGAAAARALCCLQVATGKRLRRSACTVLHATVLHASRRLYSCWAGICACTCA
jgi:hypothetical protein